MLFCPSISMLKATGQQQENKRSVKKVQQECAWEATCWNTRNGTESKLAGACDQVHFMAKFLRQGPKPINQHKPKPEVRSLSQRETPPHTHTQIRNMHVSLTYYEESLRRTTAMTEAMMD